MESQVVGAGALKELTRQDKILKRRRAALFGSVSGANLIAILVIGAPDAAGASIPVVRVLGAPSGGEAAFAISRGVETAIAPSDGNPPFTEAKIPASIELSDLDGSNGFFINGIYADDGSGVSVSSAGDVNGDGFNDILIGAAPPPLGRLASSLASSLAETLGGACQDGENISGNQAVPLHDQADNGVGKHLFDARLLVKAFYGDHPCLHRNDASDRGS
jgi:hypothetical protein